MDWKHFIAEKMKGKKFPSRQAVNAYFRKCAEEYRKLKNK